MAHSNILVGTRPGGIGRVTLNRPDRRNALSLELLIELREVLGEMATDPGIAAVVIDGSGPAFSAGHDLTEMIDRDPSFYTELFTTCTDVMLAIQEIPQPVIAQVHGMATAAGCQLVAACDLAVASDDSRFATPGVRIGLFCSTPMVPLARAIGRKRALEMLFTGEPIDAATARDWGLVNRVVDRDSLQSSTLALAAEITRYSREVVALGKSVFYRQISEADASAYDITGPIMSGNAALGDAQEGISAFLEKRSPRWGSE